MSALTEALSALLRMLLTLRWLLDLLTPRHPLDDQLTEQFV